MGALAGWLLALALQPGAEITPPPLADLPVVAIEVRSEVSPGPEIDLDSLLEIEVGVPLDDLAVRHTLRNLVATGRVSDVELDVAPEAAGIVAILVLRPAVLVSDVRIDGQLGMERRDLEEVLPQKEEQPLAEESVVSGVFNLQDLYHANGYFHATARVHVDVDKINRRAVVRYEVQSGPRATVATVTFDGSVAPFAASELLGQIQNRPGKPFRQRALEEDAEHLQTWLIGKHYNSAQVAHPREVYDDASNSVNVTYPITVGPRLTVTVAGGDFDKLRKKDLFPFLGPEGFDEALVQQALGRLRTYFQQEGYYRVRIDETEQRSASDLKVQFAISLGPTYRLEGVTFKGNESISSSQLTDLMATTPRSLIRPGSGRLVQDVLDADVGNIRAYYALQGFAHADIGPPQITEHGDGLQLILPIVEGPQMRIVKLDLNGVTKVDRGKLLKSLPIQAGGPFNQALLDQAIDTIRTSYGEKGYVRADVSASTDWDPAHRLVDISIDVLEGSLRVVDRIIVRGNRRIDTDVVQRTSGLKSGEAIGETKLYEVESRLYRLGIFSRVDAELTRSDFDSPERDVVIQVEEGKAKSVTYGAGYDTDTGPRALFGFSDNNVGRRGDRLSTYIRLSSQDTRFRVLFDQPYLGDLPIPLTSTLFYFDTTWPSFAVKSWGARTETSKLFSRIRLSLALDYRVVRLRVDSGVALNNIDRRDQPYEISSLVPAIFVDHRDDALLPKRGWSTLVQLQYSFPALESQADFLKLFYQQTHFFDLGRLGGVAASLRLGAIEAFGTLPGIPDVPETLPSSNVFINERFFGGGTSSDRAYGLDLLGIRGQTLFQQPGGRDFEPAGGNGLLIGNFDYRFPIAGPIGGTVFLDSGNVWADWRDIRVGDLKNGVGVGLRYLSPIGPLRIDVGWKLHRERHPEESPYVISFGFGNPF
jgi:outer membrane protein insertion porin family